MKLVYSGPASELVDVATRSNFLITVMERINVIMRNNIYFVPKIVELTEELLSCGNIRIDSEDIRNSVVKLLNNFSVKIGVKACMGFTDSNYNALSQTVYFNLEWIAYMQYLDPIKNAKNYRNSIAFAVCQYFHDFALKLAPGLMKICRLGKRKTNIQHEWIVNIGFRLQELMFGGKIYCDYGSVNAFSIEKLYFKIGVTGMSYETSRSVYHEFIHRIIKDTRKTFDYKIVQSQLKQRKRAFSINKNILGKRKFGYDSATGEFIEPKSSRLGFKA